jgi:hypothetical protein
MRDAPFPIVSVALLIYLDRRDRINEVLAAGQDLALGPSA